MPPSADALRAVIADDEPLARRMLVNLLAREQDVTVVGETASGPETIDVVRAEAPDVLFLDVRMPGANGIQVLQALGSDAVRAVVLVTAFDDYAVAAFEHRAIDYVLKPVDEDRFAVTLARVRERLREHRTASLAREALHALVELYRVPASDDRYLSRIMIRSTKKAEVVNVADIDWIEARGDYLALHAGRNVHLLRGTMGALEARLDPMDFVRVHRSTIVRMSRVKELEPYYHGDYSITLQDGTRLRLSRGYRARFEAALGGAL